jgi:hypothetical protein
MFTALDITTSSLMMGNLRVAGNRHLFFVILGRRRHNWCNSRCNCGHGGQAHVVQDLTQTARGSSEGVCDGKHPDGFGQLAQHIQGHFELASQSVAWHFTG